ncbi:hypothetical protein [Rhodococcus sovatensis]|jgi:hypothetical protein|uniref:Uncharacterized protein n=1 Tax=Rhodococcus sovatensis TaxID=1805840 RepID=A0ABZ2PF14_9NOCA
MARSAERTLIDLVATFLKKLTDSDIKALLDGRARLAVDYTVPSKEGTDLGNADTDVAIRLAKIASTLQSALSRDEASDILSSSNLRAADLRKLMRILDLPVSRTDTVDKLHYKLIDSTVGFKLRSDAVRGNSERNRIQANDD